MSDFNKWLGKQNTDRLAALGTDAWREALKLTSAAWDHQDAINDFLRGEAEMLRREVLILRAFKDGYLGTTFKPAKGLDINVAIPQE
jgi:hypothetical protein